MKKFMVFLLFIVLILSSHVSDSSALSESATLRIMKNTQCIYRYIPSLGYQVSVNFSVALQHHPAFIFSRSQHRPLVDFTVRVCDPRSSGLIYSVKGTAENKFALVTSRDGCHKFCFQNPYSATEVLVYFNIEVTPMGAKEKATSRYDKVPTPSTPTLQNPVAFDCHKMPISLMAVDAVKIPIVSTDVRLNHATLTASEYDKLSFLRARFRHPHIRPVQWPKLCRKFAGRTTYRRREKPEPVLGLQRGAGRPKTWVEK
uniref:GOLD domain-containing protein n=1 Tax=Opuntia streptacantha TaxID=393608 RepID=A0A7C9DR65_OPUST